MPVRNVVTWTTAISMYQQAGFPNVALDLYQLMRDGADQAIKPNAFTYCSVLNCCASVKDLGLGLRVHEQIIEEGLQNDRFLIVALIDMYTKCGKVSHARKVFDCVPQPTLEAYTAMIEGYSGNGLTSKSVELIRMVLRTGSVADKVTALGFMTIIRPCVMQMSLRHGQEIHAHIIKFGHNPGYKQLSAIVSLYERCNKMLFAYRLFNELEVKESGLWRRLLSGFFRNKLNANAMKFFAEMMTSLELGNSSFAVIDALKACIGMKGLEEGRQIHALITKVRNLMGSTSCTYLVELYSCCGDYEEALKASVVFGNKKFELPPEKKFKLRVNRTDSSFRGNAEPGYRC
ncbi:hypothetical protein HPP92_020508 [Vanilla planifolia]|uniref:Pentatricopeptide repeat-containing protein n=1 Tax=Vanilla planifolia TaxID=51239 RepID=A0A835UH21_VANPL|nr:hypothetical protein HPP92_020897 [Vanilla planifolia]KAG0462032.1 hypothetical protein HPP92_020508 [Vanilla planifolia]